MPQAPDNLNFNTKMCHFYGNTWKSSKIHIKREDIIAAGARKKYFLTQKCLIFMKIHEKSWKSASQPASQPAASQPASQPASPRSAEAAAAGGGGGAGH